MNKSDIEFTVGLDTSPAEQKLSKFLTDVQSHKNRVQKLLDNPTQYSEQAYQSKLAKLETMQNRYGIDRVNINSNIPNNDYHRFMNLQNAVARYEREMNKIFEKGNSVISVANSYSNKKNTRDAHPGMFDERMKSVTDMELERLTILQNKRNAQGAYETWKNLTSNNILALPAPPSKESVSELSEEKNKTDVEKIKDVVDQDKKDNNELKEKVVLWGKIVAKVYLLKKVIEGLAKVWKFGAETVTTSNANLNQDLGFFSVDPVGAMRANTDTTRGMIYAGIRNLGENSPVSKEGFDYTAQKFTEIWTAAMSGRDVDTRTAIDVQRLKDYFGIDLSASALLTGQREGKTATDVQLDVMRKVEKQLDKLNNADETTKGQLIDSLKNVLGEEMINAIVSNYNKNIRIDREDLQLTVAERLEQAGGSTLHARDFTEKTTMAVYALGQLKTSLEELKGTLVEDLAPAFVSATSAVTSFVNWVNKKMTLKVQDSTTPGNAGAGHVVNAGLKESDEGSIFPTIAEKKKTASEGIKSAKDANAFLDSLYWLNPNIVTEGDIENIKQRQYIDDFYDSLASGELNSESKNPLEAYFANYEYGGKKGIEALKLAEKKGVFGRGRKSGQWIFRKAIRGERLQRPKREDYADNWWGALNYKNDSNEYQGWYDFFFNSALFSEFAKAEFGEGGASDWNMGKGVFNYFEDPSYFNTADEWYEALARYKQQMEESGFGKEYWKSFNLPSKESLWGEDMHLDFGEVVFTIQTTDGRVIQSQRMTGEIVEGTQ